MDPDTANPFPEPGAGLLLFLASLALGGFVVLCQNSLVELSDQKLKKAAGEPGASPALERAARLLEQPGRFSSAMRGAYTFCHLCAVAILAQEAESWTLFSGAFWQGTWGRLLENLLITLLGVAFIMIFSRGIPRRLAARYPEALAPALSGPAAAIVALFTPLAWFTEKMVALVLALFGIRDLDQPENVTEEEIRMMVDVGEETGGIEAAEKEMILGVFDFADRTVDEIMTHRTDVIAAAEDVTLEELVALAGEHGFSRIPVVGEDGLDDILGILNVKDLLPLAVADRRKKFSVKAYVRPPLLRSGIHQVPGPLCHLQPAEEPDCRGGGRVRRHLWHRHHGGPFGIHCGGYPGRVRQRGAGDNRHFPGPVHPGRGRGPHRGEPPAGVQL